MLSASAVASCFNCICMLPSIVRVDLQGVLTFFPRVVPCSSGLLCGRLLAQHGRCKRRATHLRGDVPFLRRIPLPL